MNDQDFIPVKEAAKITKQECGIGYQCLSKRIRIAMAAYKDGEPADLLLLEALHINARNRFFMEPKALERWMRERFKPQPFLKEKAA